MSENIEQEIRIETENNETLNDTSNVDKPTFHVNEQILVEDTQDTSNSKETLFTTLVKERNTGKMLRAGMDFLSVNELRHGKLLQNLPGLYDVTIHIVAFFTNNPSIINSKEELLKAYGADEQSFGLLGIVPSYSEIDADASNVQEDGSHLIIFEVLQYRNRSRFSISNEEFEFINNHCKSFNFLRDVIFDGCENKELKAWINSLDISEKLLESIYKTGECRFFHIYNPIDLCLSFLSINIVNKLSIQSDTSKNLLDFYDKCDGTLKGMDKMFVQNAKFSQIVLEDFDRNVKENEKSKLKSIDKARLTFYKSSGNEELHFQGVGQTNFKNYINAKRRDGYKIEYTEIYFQKYISEYINSIILYNIWLKDLSKTTVNENKLKSKLALPDDGENVIDQNNALLNQENIFYKKLNVFLDGIAFTNDFASQFEYILSMNASILASTFKARTLNILMADEGARYNNNIYQILNLSENEPSVDRILGFTQYLENNEDTDNLFLQNNDEVLDYIVKKYKFNKTITNELKYFDFLKHLNVTFKRNQDNSFALFKFGFIPLTIDIDGYTLNLPAMYNPLTAHLWLDSKITNLIANSLTGTINFSEKINGTSISLEKFMPLLLEYEDLIKNNDGKAIIDKLISLPEVRFVAFIFRQIVKAIQNLDKKFLDFLRQKESVFDYMSKNGLNVNPQQRNQIIELSKSTVPDLCSSICIDFNELKYKKHQQLDFNLPYLQSQNNATFDAVGSFLSCKDTNHFKNVVGTEIYQEVLNKVPSESSNEVNDHSIEISLEENILVTDEEEKEFKEQLQHDLEQKIVESTLSEHLDFRVFYFQLYAKQIKRSKLVAKRNELLRDIANVEKEINQFDSLNNKQEEDIKNSFNGNISLYKQRIADKYKQITNQLLALKNIQKIEKVIIEDNINYLTVVLKDHTYVKDTRTDWEYDLGKLQILIPFSLKDSSVFRNACAERIRWTKAGINANDVINDGYHSNVNDSKYGPFAVVHGRGDGSVCLGDSKAMFNKAFSSNNLALCVMLAIQYAESMNDQDIWGQRCHFWCKLKPLDLQTWFEKFVIGKDIRRDPSVSENFALAQTLLSPKKLATGLDDEKFQRLSDLDIENIVRTINEKDQGLFSFKYFPNITYDTWNNIFIKSVTQRTFVKYYRFSKLHEKDKYLKTEVLQKLSVKTWDVDKQKLDDYPLYGRYNGIQNLKCIDVLRDKFHIALFKSKDAYEFVQGFVKPEDNLMFYNVPSCSNTYFASNVSAIDYDNMDCLIRESYRILHDYCENGIQMPIISCFDLFEDGSNFTISIITEPCYDDAKIIMGFLTEDDARNANIDFDNDPMALDKWIDDHSKMIIEKVPIFVNQSTTH